MPNDPQNIPPSERQPYCPPPAQYMTAMGAFAFYISFFLFAIFISYFTNHKEFAVFLAEVGTALGTLLAVAYALFGEIVQERWFPIRVAIKKVRANNIFDDADARDKDGNIIKDDTDKDKTKRVPCHCHHLCVVNETPHKPIRNCRVWLKRIATKTINGKWEENIEFAVPRLMEWAPSEYSRHKRTFSTQQVFDLGMTYAEAYGFRINIERKQGGKFNQMFPNGTTIAIALEVTGDNYTKDIPFFFSITVRHSLTTEKVTPAIIEYLKEFPI